MVSSNMEWIKQIREYIKNNPDALHPIENVVVGCDPVESDENNRTLMKALIDTLNEHLGAGYDITTNDYLHRLIRAVLDKVEE